MPTRRPAATTVRPASEETVKARDAAILGRLRIGPASIDQLVNVMPIEDGYTDEDRTIACESALIRLHVKKRIRPVDGGYAAA